MFLMNEKLHLEIKRFGKILYANIEINKINVIGGVNSSGKSTASKLLYCFLKANTLNRLDYVKKDAISGMNTIINIMANPTPYGDHGLPNRFSMDDDFREILSEYKEAKSKFHEKKGMFEIAGVFEDIIMHTDDLITVILKNEEDYSPKIVKSILESESLSRFDGVSNFYGNSFNCSIINGFKHYRNEVLANKKEYEDYDDFEFFKDDLGGFYSSKGNFDFLTDVFYIDIFSIFDMKFEDPRYREHIQYLMKNLSDSDDSDDSDTEINMVQEKVLKIIKGHFDKHRKSFSFVPKKGNENLKPHTITLKDKTIELPPRRKEFSTDNVSSGIKQIGVIELLLANHKLKPGTFLILDEPEVNLHPTWQFHFAEILVLLAKELDVVIYLNSHSPMFIEAMDAFTEYYDMEDDINYYMTEEYMVEDKYRFKKIDSNELYKLYNNLGDGYKLINELRISKRLNK